MDKKRCNCKEAGPVLRVRVEQAPRPPQSGMQAVTSLVVNGCLIALTWHILNDNPYRSSSRDAFSWRGSGGDASS
jgi:hypothetical protein